MKRYFNILWLYLLKTWSYITGSMGLLVAAGLFFILLTWGYIKSFDKNTDHTALKQRELESTAKTRLADYGENQAEKLKKGVSDLGDKVKAVAGGILDKTGAFVNAFGEKIGEFFSFKLPNGQFIDIPKGGVEEKFLQFLNREHSTDSDSESQADGSTQYFIFDRIYFATGSTQINPESDDQISSIVSILKAFDKQKVLLRGHTDNQGDKNFNLDLSQKRAQSLKKIFIEKGVSSERISIQGLGEDEPVADNETARGRRLNRRLDISLAK